MVLKNQPKWGFIPSMGHWDPDMKVWKNAGVSKSNWDNKPWKKTKKKKQAIYLFTSQKKMDLATKLQFSMCFHLFSLATSFARWRVPKKVAEFERPTKIVVNLWSFGAIWRYNAIHTLHYITLHYITLRYVTLRYVTLCYSTLRYITWYYITLHYITLHYINYIYVRTWRRIKWLFSRYFHHLYPVDFHVYRECTPQLHTTHVTKPFD